METLNYTEVQNEINRETKSLKFYDYKYRHVKLYVGSSDIAMLTCMGMTDKEGLKPTDDHIKYLPVHFGGDDDYFASIITDECDVPETVAQHYKLQGTFKHWMKIYDDVECTLQLRANKIEVYRASDYRMLIRLCK